MLDSPQVKKLIALAIEEDLAQGDITSELLVGAELESKALVVAREPLVVCGLEIMELIFDQLDWKVEVKALRGEGERVGAQTELAALAGRTRYLLGAERTVLNFLQRLCGIATFTRDFVEASSGLTVLDTRKTTPGWRALEKYAVRIGGAANHRFGLGDMILVKNNHIDARLKADSKTLTEVLDELRHHKPHYMPVEVEVRNMVELKAALAARPDAVMLDNMGNAEIKEALRMIEQVQPALQVEVSGGVSRERMAELKGLGVRCVSVGALTRKATSVDISMTIS